MSQDVELAFGQLPAIGPAYLRAVTTFGGGLAEGDTIPSIRATVDGLRVDATALERYNRVCGFADGAALPITYPHVLAFPVHMAVLTHRSFPLKLLGLVHVRNSIAQHRAIGTTESLSLHVSTGGHRQKHNGIEFDLVTEVHDDRATCLWEATSTMLSRGGGTGNRSGQRKKPENDVPENGQTLGWEVPADIGRRYAMAAGDMNPIHMSTLSAKLFGFPRAIAHGMWLKAHAAAVMADAVPTDRVRIDAAFKKPVLLPGEAHLTYKQANEGIDFALHSADGDIIHMAGGVAYS